MSFLTKHVISYICNGLKPKMSRIVKALLIISGLVSMLAMPSCTRSQRAEIVGLWEMTFMDRLPMALPRRQWEFTADNKLRSYDLPENNIRKLRTEGQYAFTKRGRFEVVKFEQDLNGEWEIVVLRRGVLRIVLKRIIDNKPAGQLLYEFKKIF